MIFDKEHCEILNKDHIVYSDDDGFYECTLAKNDDNGQLTYRMQILTNDQLAEYYVVTENSNGQISVELCHSDINLVKSKFCSLFHDLTGNFWQNRERFIHTPGYYLYTSSNDSHSSLSLVPIGCLFSSEQSEDLKNVQQYLDSVISGNH
ncbi:unnamed protein product [Rotaria magnacalcarata]|uniref:NAD(+) ADP-ribosyltransferase n=1 Tax=Rotaria magnacalcarata TaxID=392030 RepID=A0A8S2PSR4_9BILA|nr:unnamed protein product [Rotaria magnacalcarata]